MADGGFAGGAGRRESRARAERQPSARQYQKAIHDQGIPAANFFVEDVEGEVRRLKEKGVTFIKGPTRVTGSTIAVLDDSCGNLVQLTQLDRPLL